MTAPTPRVLFVCMANQCRSPLAEAIARQELGAGQLEFESAGLLAGGSRMPKAGLRVADELGLDLHSHVSRPVEAARLHEFDLVLAMERLHARELVAADQELWPRVFTLKQFSRWVAENPPPAGEPLREWLASAAADRHRSEVLGSDPADDVADPVSSPARAWRKLAEELRDHIRIILHSLAPVPPDQDIQSRIR